MKRKSVTSYKHMFLYRTGLKLDPCETFVNKFIEIYMELIKRDKRRADFDDIDENTAKFFINSCFEAIIYCMDFGFDVWLNRVMVFTLKITDFVSRHPYVKKRVHEDMKMIKIRPISSLIKKIKDVLNKDNEKYQEFIEQKKENHKAIRRYYKEYYGKQNEWWEND